jgi:hypothetical protein
MPVLITIATITYLFKGEPDDLAGFLNPAALRNRLEELPEGPTRNAALGIMDRIDTLAQEYDDATDAAIAAYIADVEKWGSTADILIEDLQPADKLRGQTLPEIIELRQQLIDALTPEEWDQVFG